MEAILNSDGRLELFAVGLANRDLVHTYQNVPNGPWQHDWTGLGQPHPLLPSGILASAPAVARNTGGRLEVFVAAYADEFGGDIALCHRWQTVPSGGPWSDWASLGRPPSLPLKPTAPAVGQNADGHLEVFACTTDNALWHIWQLPSATPTGSTTHAWQPALVAVGGAGRHDPRCAGRCAECRRAVGGIRPDHRWRPLAHLAVVTELE
jgi:hypothetical protein